MCSEQTRLSHFVIEGHQGSKQPVYVCVSVCVHRVRVCVCAKRRSVCVQLLINMCHYVMSVHVHLIITLAVH